MIKGITFDLDGVYFVSGKSNFIKSIVGLGVPEEEAVRVFLKSDRMNKEYKEGRIDDREFWTWAVREWGIDKTLREIVDLLIQGYEVNQSVRKVVKKVRANGYKTLVCSNNFPARVNGLHQQFKFLDDFDAAVFSYEVGATKPSEKIFEELVIRSGLRPEEIVFADDNPNNLAGAERVGIATFLYFSQIRECPEPPCSGMSGAPPKAEYIIGKRTEAPTLRRRGGRHKNFDSYLEALRSFGVSV